MIRDKPSHRVSYGFISVGVLALSILLFFFLNQILPIDLQSYSSQRISFIIIFFSVIFFGRFTLRFDLFDVFIFPLAILLILYSFLISLIFASDFVQTSRFFHFVLFSLIGPFLVFRLCKDEICFHKAVVFAALAQVFFVILTYSSSNFSNFVFSYIDSGGQSLSGARAPGLSSAGGASLSVVISLGALSILRLSDLQPRIWHISILVFIACSVALVGRTGMLVSLFCLSIIILRGRTSIKSLSASFLLVSIFGFIVFDTIKSNPQFFERTLSWALSVFLGTDQTIHVLLGQDLREITQRILLFGGVGVSSPDGSNASGSDVGYLQTSYAIGVPLAFLFYMTYFLYLCHFNVSKNDVFYKYFLIFLVIILELKEPFIFKYAISFYVLSSILHMRKSKTLVVSKS